MLCVLCLYYPNKKEGRMKYRTINLPLKTHENLKLIKKKKEEMYGVRFSLAMIISEAIQTKYPKECGFETGSETER